MTENDSSIGLALGGGAALGAAHVGVLRAMEELEINIDYLAGTSIGAMVSALYAFGMPVDEIESIALDLDWPDVSGIALSKMGLLTNNELGMMLDNHLGNVTFEEADIPLAVIGTDISTGEKLIIDEGDVSDAVKASTCIPVLFEPVRYHGRLLVDGGLKESVPVSALQAFEADYIIGVDLGARREYEQPNNILGILNNTLEIALSHLAHVNPLDIDLIIQPDLGKFSRTDTENTAEMIEIGYRSAKESFSTLSSTSK
ncbi:patatin-like phospholipase family protein [Fodinibius halophilus]|uniref:Patatin n=1 Tax=Fodinibius halophilus TaxID=1736908 RepID=A0A6M1T8P4_9BACT|nr:patatin-like phospholipase family protein [Fodinibius halophilus]NGP87454.1 patatin [Fodinibius halophilus]